MPNLFRRVLGKKVEEASDAEFSVEVGPLVCLEGCGGPASGVDLVFVHGLRGSRQKTWSRDGVFWPQDLLKDDLEKIRVISWGYDASIANAFAYASKESLFGHATTLLNDLAGLGRGITRPIIFICHSLGGLVVKEALITSASYKAHARHPTLGEIYARTVGVLFMGTPHRGSSKETYGNIAANVAMMSLRQPNKQLLQTLKPDSHILEKQRDDFTTISKQMMVVCIREELPTGAGMIVPEASASYDGFNVTRDAIHANHMDMVKFSTRAEGYERTLNHIKNIVDARLPRMEQDENQKLKTWKNAVLGVLETGTMGNREMNIEGAYSQTCSWIWGEEPESTEAPSIPCEFTSWLQNAEPLLWISGKAGCGKSTLMKHIYHDAQTERELRRSSTADGKSLILVGHFFSDRGHDEEKSREGMLRSILFQVLKKRPDLITAVFPQGSFRGDPSLRGHKFEEGLQGDILTLNRLSRALISLLDHLGDAVLCLFLDGLDEYRMAGREKDYTEEDLDMLYDGDNEDEAWGRSVWITEGHKEIAAILRQLNRRGTTKVCVSSRELVVFEQEFRDSPRIVVHTHTAGAIAAYCQGRLASEASNLTDLHEFVSAITSKSCGVFLWVKLVVDMLVDGYIQGDYKEELWKTLEKLPSRLGGKNGLYMQMMQNVKREHLGESRRLFELILGKSCDIITLFLAEPGHLRDGSTQDLRVRADQFELKSWDEWESRWSSLHRRLKSRCAGLLEGTKDVQFMHQTAKEFISRSYLWPDIFHDAIGFATHEDVLLARMSGRIRRLKCCSEMIANGDHTDADRGACEIPRSIPTLGEYINMVIDPYPNVRLLEKASDRFLDIFGMVSDATSKPPSALPYFVEQLFDELDAIGNRLTQDIRASRGGADVGWLGVYFVPIGHLTDYRLPIGNILDFAITMGCPLYVTSKLRALKGSEHRLSQLLARAATVQEIALHRPDYERSFISGWHPELVELLLQEGANPNSPDVESFPNIRAREGWTIWTTFLGQARAIFPGYQKLDDMRKTVKLFLEYGADPTARWYPPIRYKGGGMDIRRRHLTPEIAFNDIFRDDPQLGEFLELLQQAKTKGRPEIQGRQSH